MFFLWKFFHNRLSLLFSGFGNNFDTNAASTDYGGGNGGTHADAIGNSGFIGNPGNGAFVNQSGGKGNRVDQYYIAGNLNINVGTSLSQEGNQLSSEYERRDFVPRSRFNTGAKHHR
jgi:hypothetical protein